MDPNDIFYSTPTFSDDLPPLVPLEEDPGKDAVVFHEDDWSQLEFFPKSELPQIQRILQEFKPFEEENRMENGGWRKPYARKVKRVPVLSDQAPVKMLEKLLSARAGGALILASSDEAADVVEGGFTLPVGGDVVVYGYVSGHDVPVLGVALGENVDDAKIVEVFMKLHASDELILVHWEQQLVLLGVDENGQIDVWEP